MVRELKKKIKDMTNAFGRKEMEWAFCGITPLGIETTAFGDKTKSFYVVIRLCDKKTLSVYVFPKSDSAARSVEVYAPLEQFAAELAAEKAGFEIKTDTSGKRFVHPMYHRNALETELWQKYYDEFMDKYKKYK